MARDEQGNIVFDQDEQSKIDQIIAERLARAKAEKPADYDELKGIAETLEILGYSGTVTEQKEALKALADSYQTQSDVLDDVAEEGEIPDEAVIKALAKKFGTTPERLEKSMKKAIEADEADEKKVKADADWKSQVSEFETKNPDIDLAELEKDAKFVKFARTHTGTLSTVYEDYLELIGETETEIAGKIKSSVDRSTGGGKGSSSDGNHGLSPSQLKMLTEFNKGKPARQQMTAKEYKELNVGY